MTTTIPLNKTDLENLNFLLKTRKVAQTKTDVFRIALRRLAEEESINAILNAQKEIDEGKGLKGDIRKLSKLIK